MRLYRSHIPAILWTLAIISSCLVPASSFKRFSFDSILELDKIIHFIMYAGFFILWRLSADKLKSKYSVILLFTAILLGIGIEVIQGEMKYGRTYDEADMVANTIGAFLGLLISPFIINRLPLIKKYLPFMVKLYR